MKIKLVAINKKLFEVLKQLKKLNEPGKQYDYVNKPDIGGLIDANKKLADQISAIYYQETEIEGGK